VLLHAKPLGRNRAALGPAFVVALCIAVLFQQIWARSAGSRAVQLVSKNFGDLRDCGFVESFWDDSYSMQSCRSAFGATISVTIHLMNIYEAHPLQRL
jgi:hypothetical protein